MPAMRINVFMIEILLTLCIDYTCIPPRFHRSQVFDVTRCDRPPAMPEKPVTGTN
jgi:hypothetical protein